NEDGSMSRVPQLVEFCTRHGLRMISVADLIRYRLQNESIVKRSGEGCIRTEFGDFRSIAYTTTVDAETHLALVHGDVDGREGVLVRVHSHCVYGDVFGSTDCECQHMIRGSLKRIVEERAGVLVYLHQTGPGLRIQKEDGRARLLTH